MGIFSQDQLKKWENIIVSIYFLLIYYNPLFNRIQSKWIVLKQRSSK